MLVFWFQDVHTSFFQMTSQLNNRDRTTASRLGAAAAAAARNGSSRSAM